MNKFKAKNEKVKRQYFKYLREAEGFAPKTIEAIEKALWKFEEFTKEDDYAHFNEKQANQFKKWLLNQTKKKTKDKLSLTTHYHCLRHLKAFFMWLSGQPGYKSRISAYDANYLKLDKKQSRIATSSKQIEYPSLDYVIKLCRSIKIITEIDLRDRALIAFHFLSAMRVTAIYTLPIKCFNPVTLEVFQSPKDGVKTKFAKTIHTTLFSFNDELMAYVLDWFNYLTKEKCFDNKAPIFPKTKLEQKSENDACFEGKEIMPEYWQAEGAILTIFKNRAKNAGLKYYSPHKFRHGAIAEARKYARTPEQQKAISQNVGHEHMGTTFAYGNMDDFRINEVISKMSFNRSDEKDYNLENIPIDILLKEIKNRT